MRVTVTTEVDAPEGATHYTQRLLRNPVWWRQTREGWYVWNRGWCFTLQVSRDVKPILPTNYERLS